MVSTPNPSGGRIVNQGSCIALRALPPCAELVNGLRFRSSTCIRILPRSDKRSCQTSVPSDNVLCQMAPSARVYAGMAAEERRARRRARLLEAGLELLGTKGAQATSVTAVCRLARLTPRYF